MDRIDLFIKEYDNLCEKHRIMLVSKRMDIVDVDTMEEIGAIILENSALYETTCQV